MAEQSWLEVLLPDGKREKLPVGEDLLTLSRRFQSHFSSTIVAATIDNELKELTYRPDKGGFLEFLDLHHPEGMRIYHRSLTFLLIVAAKELFPDGRLLIEHSLGKGLYCELHKKPPLSSKDVEKLEQRMRELVEADVPFSKERIPLEEAISYFRQEGYEDKARLLKYRKKPYLNVYSCGPVKEYLYGYLVPSSGYLKTFSLKHHMPGFVLRFPDEHAPDRIPPYVEQPKLFKIFREAEKWCDIMGIATVGALNDYIAAGKGEELVWLAEALHEKKVAQIADMICNQENKIRVILIAGPSSSGKTTFAQRLTIQLRVNGLHPVSISLDDYFVDREQTPRNEEGELDFEALEAIDLDLFNEQLTAMIQGEEVEVPYYNFQRGKREYRGRKVQVDQSQPIIIEGIHGLNDRLTSSVPRDKKFKVYISALTSLNIDQHNRIPTTDGRIIRRIIRDCQFRGHDAATTIKLWPMVRRGEEKNIFPFQEEADVMFNSALIYELAVLKKYAEPLLESVDPTKPEYLVAKRLLKFLKCFLPLDDVEIPSTSILREFIGGSCLVT